LLTSLSIINYALIDRLHVNFDGKLTIITGETGAGKSILLGGLSLILGKRADLNSLKNKEEKCIIEAEFSIEKYKLKSFFSKADIDYEEKTIIRREILPSGKSRAFINDTPVNLDILGALGVQLIDVHSQHQTLQLTENNFQFKIIDAVSKNESHLNAYKTKLAAYLTIKKQLQELENFQSDADKEHDYNSFLLKELQEIKLEIGIIEELETSYEKLNNVEEIKEKLNFSNQLLTEEKLGLLSNLNELKNTYQKLAGYGSQYEDLLSRINSLTIELDDISSEVHHQEEQLDLDPKLLEEVNMQLQQLYNLQKKHNALGVEELIEIRNTLEQKVATTENLESDIKKLQSQIISFENELDGIAIMIRSNREKAIPNLIESLEKSLLDLGMPNARFNIQLNKTTSYLSNGKDELQFLFSANKGTGFGELKKVASGGELSRIMLVIKALLAKHMQLPTIMFDEIDTGISGEISNKMGDIMSIMSKHMQVFTITHLPQVAAKGNSHFKVFKEDVNEITVTKMRELDIEERTIELAEMLGGKEISVSALAHAKELLN